MTFARPEDYANAETTVRNAHVFLEILHHFFERSPSGSFWRGDLFRPDATHRYDYDDDTRLLISFDADFCRVSVSDESETWRVVFIDHHFAKPVPPTGRQKRWLAEPVATIQLVSAWGDHSTFRKFCLLHKLSQ